jgi:hypothetical protein
VVAAGADTPVAADPLYARYLSPADLHRLFQQSVAEGELL